MAHLKSMMSRAGLLEVSQFAHSSEAERRALMRQVIAHLGLGWRKKTIDMSVVALPLRHEPSGMDFLLIPGGVLRMGISDDDLAEASEYFDWTEAVARQAERMAAAARPVHRVRVAPFLCAQRLHDPDGSESAYLERSAATTLAASHGMRLVSEAELEWLARDGGRFGFILDVAARGIRDERKLRSRFGVSELFELQWVADEWHDDYVGAPEDSSPWLGGDARGVSRGGLLPAAIQSDEELLAALAGARWPGGEAARVRLAVDLP